MLERASTELLPAYAELQCLSNFTFLNGASHPEELVARAAQLGYSALALTDECSVAGVVRAHTPRAVALSHSIPLGYLLAASPVSIYPLRQHTGPFLDTVSYYPFAAAGIALAVWLTEKGICICGLSDHLRTGR